jgi:hypothetical protein
MSNPFGASTSAGVHGGASQGTRQDTQGKRPARGKFRTAVGGNGNRPAIIAVDQRIGPKKGGGVVRSKNNALSARVFQHLGADMETQEEGSRGRDSGRGRGGRNVRKGPVRRPVRSYSAGSIISSSVEVIGLNQSPPQNEIDFLNFINRNITPNVTFLETAWYGMC